MDGKLNKSQLNTSGGEGESVASQASAMWHLLRVPKHTKPGTGGV